MQKLAKQIWWKILGILLLLFTLIGGLSVPLFNGQEGMNFPNLPILNESIRNLLYHVPMWFAMVYLLLMSFIFSIRFLGSNDLKFDRYAAIFAKIGVLFGTLGILTGMIWAKATWGAFWTNDPKLNGAAIGMLIYFAYLILRISVDDETKRAKLSATYNIFAFVMYLAFIFVIPRLTDSLHPGNGGNPAFSSYDLDNNLRLFFYPAVLGWIFFSSWICSIWIRIENLKAYIEDDFEMENELENND